MKHKGIFILLALFFAFGCKEAVDVTVNLVPNKPFIRSAKLAYMDTTGLIKGNISQTNSVDTIHFVDSIIVKDRTVDLKNIWAQMTLETGCKVEPLENSPKLGAYGDFSKPAKYRVTAPSGRIADWTLIVELYTPKLGILSERWVGDLTCVDGIWNSYSPTYCKGVKIDNSPTKVRLTFDFWGMKSLETVLDLELGEIDLNTFIGPVTLLNDFNAVGGGYNMTFLKGAAGTYNAASSELNLVLNFKGYSIGGDGKYRFTVKK
jgi:hypothetical protein